MRTRDEIKAKLDPDALEAAKEAGSDVVMYDTVSDYGFGGDVYDREVVSNMDEVVAQAISAYVETIETKRTAEAGALDPAEGF